MRRPFPSKVSHIVGMTTATTGGTLIDVMSIDCLASQLFPFSEWFFFRLRQLLLPSSRPIFSLSEPLSRNWLCCSFYCVLERFRVQQTFAFSVALLSSGHTSKSPAMIHALVCMCVSVRAPIDFFLLSNGKISLWDHSGCWRGEMLVWRKSPQSCVSAKRAVASTERTD